MNWQKIAVIAGALAAFPAIGAGGWWVWQWSVSQAMASKVAKIDEKIDNLNVVVIRNAEDIEVVGKSVKWIRLENYEALLRKGGRLSRQECARYRALAKSLGVKPLAC